MDLTILVDSIKYVTQAPFFWGSMGFTTALAMFVGAIVHNGDLTQVKKTLISLFGYLFILIQVTFTRVINDYNYSLSIIQHSDHPHKAIAGIVTIIFITLCWMLGIFLGVWILHSKKKK